MLEEVHVKAKLNCFSTDTENLKDDALLTVEHQQFMDLYCSNLEVQYKHVKQEKVFLEQEAYNDLMDASEQFLEKLGSVKTTHTSDDYKVTESPKPLKPLLLSNTEALQGFFYFKQ